MRQLILSSAAIPQSSEHDFFCTISGNYPCTHTDVYITASEALLIETDEPPIIVSKSFHTMLRRTMMISLASDVTALEEIPLAIADEKRALLKRYLAEFSHAMMRGFPFIQPDHRVIRNGVAAAANIWKAYREQIRLVNAEILANAEYSAIRTNFKVILEFIMGLNYTHPLRRAIFANLVSCTHAWISIHRVLDLPSLFIAHEYVDFLQTVSRYVPTYFGTESWYLDMPEHVPGDLVYSIPLIPHRNDGVDLTSILDHWDFDEIAYSTEIDTLVDSFSSAIDEFGGSSDCSDYVSVYRTSLHFMRYHPLVNATHVDEFCGENYVEFQHDIEQIARDCDVSYRDQITAIILDLFRVCGRDDFLHSSSLVQSVVDFLIRRKEGLIKHIPAPFQLQQWMYTLLGLSTQVLRSKIRLIWDRDSTTLSYDDQHFRILTHFMQNFPTAYTDRVCEVIGIVMGLLLVERHPDFIHGVRLLPHRATQAGFCKVVNCVAFQTLFDYAAMQNLSQAFATSFFSPYHILF